MALQRALEMEQGERADRTRRNLEYSQRLTTANWATQVSQHMNERMDEWMNRIVSVTNSCFLSLRISFLLWGRVLGSTAFIVSA